MNKRLEGEYSEFIYKGEPVPFTLGTLVVVIFLTVVLIVATFTKLDISHYWISFNSGTLAVITKDYQLVPQIPVVMMIAAILGARFGSVVILLYMLIGFFLWPVFAFGGGIGYVKSYFFGYILGFIVANIFSGRLLSGKFTFKNVLIASIIGVVSIHACGMLYSFILGIFNFSTYAPDTKFVFTQIAYDIVLSLIAITLAIPVKYVLWNAMKNEPKRNKKVEYKNIQESE